MPHPRYTWYNHLSFTPKDSGWKIHTIRRYRTSPGDSFARNDVSIRSCELGGYIHVPQSPTPGGPNSQWEKRRLPLWLERIFWGFYLYEFLLTYHLRPCNHPPRAHQRKISVLRRLVQKRVFYNIHFWKQHVANHAPWTFSAGWYVGTEARPVVGAGTKWWQLKEVKNHAHIGVFGWLVQLGWITNCLSWERYVPPPFLDVWKKFIDLLQRSDRTSANFDQIIPQLLPMFNCSTFKLPFRLLNIHEVLQLSGLANHWTMTDLDDAAGRFNVLCLSDVHQPVTTEWRTIALLGWITNFWNEWRWIAMTRLPSEVAAAPPPCRTLRRRYPSGGCSAPRHSTEHPVPVAACMLCAHKVCQGLRRQETQSG